MRALDLFSGAGGVSRGLKQAGFHVVGVDHKPQRNYCGDVFIQADALSLTPEFLRGFDFIWSSPPCQALSTMRHVHNAKPHLNLIPATRALLKAAGRPFVIENVEGARVHLIDPTCLCGSMFGLRAPSGELRRHRLFEVSGVHLAAPTVCRHRSPTIGIYGAHLRDRRRLAGTNHKSGSNRPWEHGFIAMGVPIGSMTLAELSQAIPPIYARAAVMERIHSETDQLAELPAPYRFDTPRKRRDAEWFVEHWRKYRGVKHIRGLHYKLIGGATKPNGHRYVGDFANFTWLQTASAAARWLGLIAFDEFEDRRSGDPFIYRTERDPTPLTVGADSSFGAEPTTIDIFDGEEGELRLFPTIVGMKAEQQFLLAIFGEKSSIRGEAEPLAIELGADLYLETGEQSATHVYHIAQRADADGRDLVVLAITDCDPAGYQMAVSIARKLQALIDLHFPALNATVIHIGLTPAQVRHYRLPSSPLSPKELRRTRWRERMGVQQTEIDALLTRHPGALTAMIREALKPYYDPTLNSRVRRAEGEWRADAEAKIEEQIADDPELTGLMQGAEERASDVTTRIEVLNVRIEQIRDLVMEINDEAEFDQARYRRRR